MNESPAPTLLAAARGGARPLRNGGAGLMDTTRRALLGCLAAAALPVRAAPAAATLAAAWQSDRAYRVGLLRPGDDGLAVAAALDVPTRAHGLLAESSGHLLAVARRPGDWLLRWGRDGRPVAWAWNQPDRAYNGHVLAGPDGRRLYTTETDLETGQGVIGVRDAASLEKIDEWPTHGMDPHELTWDPEGRLLVANGGIPTLPETGRLKIGLDRMDASLVRLDPRSGRLLGQWRLKDPRLSLRHVAWLGPVLGIALQAEHDDPARKAGAPVLALFDGERLRVAPAGRVLAGYGGDVAGVGDVLAVSCPRAGGVAWWRADGSPAGFAPLEEACPLAASGDRLWAGGRRDALLLPGDGRLAVGGVQLDNHWIVVA